MNVLKFSVGVIAFFASAMCFAENVSLEKKDYAVFLVSNYVHGFKEFDTSVAGYEDAISIGIYYDVDTQSKARADQLARRFEENIPNFLSGYDWAQDMAVKVNVYSENRSEQGY